MKKLLHERLREWVEKSKKEDSFPSAIAIEETSEYGYYDAREQERKLFVEFADEIERYYIPRPRFEDGEPVQFGDKVEELPGCVYSFELFSDCSGRVVDFCDNSVVFDEEPFYLKRPQPKVLDADGVEINVGDTVYFQNDPTPRIVEIAKPFNVKTTDGHQYPHPDRDLTHNEPDSIGKIHAEIWDYINLEMIGGTSEGEWLESIADRLSALAEKVGA